MITDLPDAVPSIEDYTSALTFLLETAEQGEGSGAWVSANILISANGGSAGKIGITELRLLDNDRQKAALTVIFTVMNNYQNQADSYVENGPERFQAIFRKFLDHE